VLEEIKQESPSKPAYTEEMLRKKGEGKKGVRDSDLPEKEKGRGYITPSTLCPHKELQKRKRKRNCPNNGHALAH